MEALDARAHLVDHRRGDQFREGERRVVASYQASVGVQEIFRPWIALVRISVTARQTIRTEHLIELRRNECALVFLACVGILIVLPVVVGNVHIGIGNIGDNLFSGRIKTVRGKLVAGELGANVGFRCRIKTGGERVVNLDEIARVIRVIGEVAGLPRGERNNVAFLRGGALANAFRVYEEERLVLPVVELRHPDGSGEVATEFVANQKIDRLLVERLRGECAVLMQLKQFAVIVVRTALGDHFDNSGPAVFGVGVGRAYLKFLNCRDGLGQALQFIGVAFRCRHAIHQIVDGSTRQSVHPGVALPLPGEAVRDDARGEIQDVQEAASLHWQRPDARSLLHVTEGRSFGADHRRNVHHGDACFHIARLQRRIDNRFLSHAKGQLAGPV